MTDAEVENIQQQFAEAKQKAYRLGRLAERKSTINIIEDLLSESKYNEQTIAQALLITLRKNLNE